MNGRAVCAVFFRVYFFSNICLCIVVIPIKNTQHFPPLCEETGETRSCFGQILVRNFSYLLVYLISGAVSSGITPVNA